MLNGLPEVLDPDTLEYKAVKLTEDAMSIADVLLPVLSH
jgi:hypothetical protein